MSNTHQRFINVAEHADRDIDLPAGDGLPATRHRHEAPSLHAINTALASGRPLLVRGEPGTGKSQLARAAARLLDRAFVSRVVDAQTQVADLFYSFDAVERLAQAQVAGALRGSGASDLPLEELLNELNFVRPGPLWWAFDAAGARAQERRYESRSRASKDTLTASAGTGSQRGYVVLIDEIDKTDPSVPNGLLEALGQGTFPVPRGKVSLHGTGPAPLTIITTNEERELPSAFVRRCLVLHLQLPAPDQGLESWLVARGHTHFPELSEALRRRAAELVIRDRVQALRIGLSPPGQAEYLDLLRAVRDLAGTDDAREKLLAIIAPFALKKHPALHGTAESG